MLKLFISIVALHGLNGHAFDTWQYSSDDDCFMWLRDILPEHFPGARILTYGYNANVVSDISTGRLRTFAETLLEKLRLERGENVSNRILYRSMQILKTNSISTNH